MAARDVLDLKIFMQQEGGVPPYWQTNALRPTVGAVDMESAARLTIKSMESAPLAAPAGFRYAAAYPC